MLTLPKEGKSKWVGDPWAREQHTEVEVPKGAMPPGVHTLAVPSLVEARLSHLTGFG